MITLLEAALLYPCPTCDAEAETACDRGKSHVSRLNLASANKGVIHMTVESMIHAENSRDWKN